MRCSAAAALIAVLSACSGDLAGPGNGGVPVARVVIAPDSVALPRGQTMRLEALLLDGGGNVLDDRDVRWTSSDTLRVKIAPTGVITASEVGSSLVSAASEGKADTVKVIVTQ